MTSETKPETSSQPSSALLQTLDPTTCDNLAAYCESEAERREKRIEDLTTCLNSYAAFCGWVQTEWEDEDTRAIRRAPYPFNDPEYEFLRDYNTAYNDAYDQSLDFACLKSRGMIATYDPLIDWLWRAVVSYHRGGIWKMAITRQNHDDAMLLVERTQRSYDLLPELLRPPTSLRTKSEFRIGNAVLRALHQKGEAGRGEAWNRWLSDEHAVQEHAERNWIAFDRVYQKMAVSTPNGENHFKFLIDGNLPGVVVYDLGYERHPDRKPGTERGEAWKQKKIDKIGDRAFLVEHERRFDIYLEPGLLSDDFSEECVVDVVPGSKDFNWDGKSEIIVSIDPGKVKGAGAMIRYFNDQLQDIRLASFFRQGMDTDEFTDLVCSYAVARWSKADWLLTGDPAAKQERSHKTRYNEHSDEQIIRRVASQRLAGVEYDDEGNVVKGSPLPFQIDRIPQGSGSRKQRHALQRMGFRKRHDGRRGTLIVRSENVEFLRGCRGAYKLPKNATPNQEEFEKPDRSMPCIHPVDADGCGLAQFVKFAGVPTLTKMKRARPRRQRRPIRDPVTGYIRGWE